MPPPRKRARTVPSRRFKKAGMFRSKRRVGAFKKRVKAIARGVVARQNELKMYDLAAPSNYLLSSASVPIGANVLGYVNFTEGPAQGTGGGQRIGVKIHARKTILRWSVSNITATGNASANKAGWVRFAVLEMLDQKDEGNILTLPGNAMFEQNAANVDMQTFGANRMHGLFNKRIYRVLHDQVYRMGCGVNADAPKTVYGQYVHSWGGQEWSFETTSASTATERRIYGVWFIDSQDQNRTASTTHEIQADLDFTSRLYFTD